MKVIISLFCLVLISCSTQNASEKRVSQYKTKAHKLVLLAKDEKASAKEIERNAMDLIALAKPMIESFISTHKKCNEVLSEVIAQSEKMTTLNLAQIERDYHDAKALPKADDDCYEPKELIVHPATVVIVSRQKFNKEGRAQIVDEMEEVLAHLDLLIEH
jgi:hypothetical protein